MLSTGEALILFEKMKFASVLLVGTRPTRSCTTWHSRPCKIAHWYRTSSCCKILFPQYCNHLVVVGQIPSVGNDMSR